MYHVTLTESAGRCVSFDTIFTINAPQFPVAKFFTVKDTIDLAFENKIIVQNQSQGGQFFHWDFGDGTPEQIVINPSAHPYSTAGAYSVQLIAIDGVCTDTAHAGVVVTDFLTHVEQKWRFKAPSVYPNPSQGKFNFELSETEKVTLDIFDLTGKLVFHQETGGGDELLFQKRIIEADLSHLDAGAYLYKIMNGSVLKHSGMIKKD
jgi:hypothetical protein